MPVAFSLLPTRFIWLVVVIGGVGTLPTPPDSILLKVLVRTGPPRYSVTMNEENEKNQTPKIRLIIEVEEPQERLHPSHNELLEKEKGIHRKPGDWFKEE